MPDENDARLLSLVAANAGVDTDVVTNGLLAAYLAGFDRSAEGFNGEYGVAPPEQFYEWFREWFDG